MAYVYMLSCDDGTLYVGSTRDLEARLYQHRTGMGSAYVRKRLPVELVYSCEVATIEEAYYLERRLHGWGRAKREALIAGRFDLLPALSKKRWST